MHDAGTVVCAVSRGGSWVYDGRGRFAREGRVSKSIDHSTQCGVRVHVQMVSFGREIFPLSDVYRK